LSHHGGIGRPSEPVWVIPAKGSGNISKAVIPFIGITAFFIRLRRIPRVLPVGFHGKYILHDEFVTPAYRQADTNHENHKSPQAPLSAKGGPGDRR